MAGLRVLDASVVIALLDADDVHHDDAQRVFETYIDDDLAMSVLTLAEVLFGPTQVGRGAEVTRALDELGIRTVEIPGDAASRLAELRAETRLRMPDCCVLLTAELLDGSVATFDQRLAASAANLLGPS